MNILNKILRTKNISLDARIKNDNINRYYWTVSRLYDQGNYVEALKGLRKLLDFNNEFYVYLIPYIEKCKKLTKMQLSKEDIEHYKNIEILRKFGWLVKIKYFTGLLSLWYWGRLIFGEDFFNRKLYLFLAIVFSFLTFLIHFKMKKFAQSKYMVRCKYCGRFTYNIEKEEMIEYYWIPNIAFSNQCIHCNRKQPEPSFIWDSWDGLIYAASLYEEASYELNQLKKKHSILYNEWIKDRNKKKKYKLFSLVDINNWELE